MKKIILMLIGLSLVGFTGQIFADDEFRNECRQEISESTEREGTQTEVALERKVEDTERGRTVIDVNGYRVRVEKYLSRPQANQIKTLVLNTRADLDNRVDQSEWLGTFNKDLPESLKGIGKTMWGSFHGKPEYYLTNTNRKDSSGDNYIQITRDDGWLFHKAQTDKYDVYVVLFNNELIVVNGKEKIKQERWGYKKEENLQGLVKRYFPNENGELKLLTLSDKNNVKPNFEYEKGSGEMKDKLKFTFKDGTFLTRTRYLINDDGEVLPSGTSPMAGNREIIHEATEFGGKTIDIVITPEPEQAEQEISVKVE